MCVCHLTPPNNNAHHSCTASGGGRLGRWVEGEADLRNLAVVIVPCQVNDAFVVLSGKHALVEAFPCVRGKIAVLLMGFSMGFVDGVHDNLDPEKLGVVMTSEIIDRFGCKDWGALPVNVNDNVKVSEDCACFDAKKSDLE